MNLKPVYTTTTTFDCEVINDSMFSLADIFKLNKDRKYWFRQHRQYLKSLKDPINNPTELAFMYSECTKMVNLARLLKKQRPKRYYTRINTGEYVGPFATSAAAHNRAFKEKE